MSTTRFETRYMDSAVFCLEDVLNEAIDTLQHVGHEFDTLVGTGFSGSVVIPALALHLNKTFVLIRKETDDSHHGSGRLLGELGERWIFVDDFISSGATLNRVIEKVGAAAQLNDYRTTYVGNYMYEYSSGQKYERRDPIRSPELTPRREDLFGLVPESYFERVWRQTVGLEKNGPILTPEMRTSFNYTVEGRTGRKRVIVDDAPPSAIECDIDERRRLRTVRRDDDMIARFGLAASRKVNEQ